MTREEMWEEFENQLKREVHTPITMSYDDSIRLAELGIKETVARWKKRLEQHPSTDCISRAEAIKGLGEQPPVWTDSNSEIQQLLDWREHKEMLERLPSVGQKVGHWIVEIWNNREHHTCSECQRVVDYEPRYHYCPYCGAKLSEVEK